MTEESQKPKTIVLSEEHIGEKYNMFRSGEGLVALLSGKAVVAIRDEDLENPSIGVLTQRELVPFIIGDKNILYGEDIGGALYFEGTQEYTELDKQLKEAGL